MSLTTPAQIETADRYLGAWLSDCHIGEVRLGEAARALSSKDDRAIETDADAIRLGDKITLRLVSTLLRKRGFVKVGESGSGYDREPVYRSTRA